MTATSVYSSLFASATSSTPLNGTVLGSPFGGDFKQVTYTYADTSLDELGDFVGLIPVRAGCRIQQLVLSYTDCDSGSDQLDMDIILRTTSSAGVNTDTILYNASTAFGTAVSTPLIIQLPTEPQVPDDADGVGIIGTYVNVARNGAATPTLTLGVWTR